MTMKKQLFIALISGTLSLTALPAFADGHGKSAERKTEMVDEMTKSKINVNTADAKTLAKLPGIGKKKAMAIIEYREAYGDFADVGQLMKVKGIGKKTAEKLAPVVVFK